MVTEHANDGDVFAIAAVACAADHTVVCAFGDSLLVPRGAGIYLFWDLRGVLYVGRSDNLRRRYREHRFAESNPLLRELMARPVGPLRFSWVLASGLRQGEVERELIRFFNPPANRVRYACTG